LVSIEGLASVSNKWQTGTKKEIRTKANQANIGKSRQEFIA